MAQVPIQNALALAFQHHQAGRLRQAEEIYRRILAQQPGNIDALHYLGVLAHQAGRNDIAIDLIRRALTIQPTFAEAHNNLGLALKDHGQLDEAIAAYRKAIGLRPDFAQAHSNLGLALKDAGELPGAIASYRRAIALQPKYAEAHNNLGVALQEAGQLDDAIAALGRAINLRANYADAYSNLGNVLNEKGELDEAIAAYRRALAIEPRHAKAHYNLGIALQFNAQFDDAVAAYRQAIALKPDYANAHKNLALLLMAKGDFPLGWEEYEWRWKSDDFSFPARNFPRPQWDGSPLGGRTILLHAEMGFGDAIQFIRYLPMVIERGGRVIVEAPMPLLRLLRQSPGVQQWIARGDALPPFDLHCPLLSLPRALATALATIPAEIPYLFPDPGLLDSWRKKIPAAPLNVGLAWAGNPDFRGDPTRSITLDRLTPLSKAIGAAFFSVQKGNAQQQADHPPAGLELVNLGPELHDFAETAAALSLMDMVITTDTSIAHLAGALGRPVWLMLQFIPDWRWMRDRDDSPWYPTMRLFRQPSPGDWQSVVRKVADALSLRIRMPG